MFLSPLWFAVLFVGAVVWLLRRATRRGRAEVAREAAEKDTQRAVEERKAASALSDYRKRRDADVQVAPFKYKIGQHGNEALAIRYGIANLQPSSGSSSQSRKVPSDTVSLRKLGRLDGSKFRVALVSHRDREAVAVIEPGTDYVKTFYPLDPEWFTKNAALETTLKGNGTFSLKELAKFHVEKAV